MILRKVSLDNKSDLEFIEKLYIESFPPNERRPVLEMHHLMEENDKFRVFVLIDEGANGRVGLITYWNFNSFIYLEHFAINPESRNGGYGGKAIRALIESTDVSILGEIELPSSSEFAARRLNFYIKYGFKAWDLPYEQPPYEEGFDPIPMLLLTYGDLDLNKDYEFVVNQLYSEVYKWKPM